MDRYLRVAGIAGGTAFILSAIVGGAAGVGIAVLLLRSILWTLVFGALGAGSVYVFEKALVPEGGVGPSPSASPAAGGQEASHGETGDGAPAVGENVDIVVDDEPVANQFAALAGSDGFVDDEADGPAPVVPSMIEEVVETQVDDTVPVSAEGDPVAATPATVAPDVDVAESAPPPSPPASPAPAGAETGELPDIGGMAGEFVQPVEEVEVDEMDTMPIGGGGVGGDDETGGMAGNDPAALAKALQTMLKRD